MRKHLIRVIGALLAVSLQSAAFASGISVTGTIQSLVISSPNAPSSDGGTPPSAETVSFSISPAPTTSSGCKNGTSLFVFSPNSITDANTRRDMFEILLSARATGASVTVAYDISGNYCDTVGFPAPLAVNY
jgi:hypothetical protein